MRDKTRHNEMKHEITTQNDKSWGKWKRAGRNEKEGRKTENNKTRQEE